MRILAAMTLLLAVCVMRAGADGVPVFQGAMIHFHPDSSDRYVQPGERVTDRGRVVETRAWLPRAAMRERLVAHVIIEPVPKTEREVFDRWDRAGNVRLAVPGKPDVELVRFMTAYGGRTEYDIDVSELAPLLADSCTLRAHIDTWVSPAWRLSLALRTASDKLWDAPAWAAPVVYTDSYDREHTPHGLESTIDVPRGMKRVVLRYLATGHCTDGTDEDEFVSKANVISVDGRAVARVHPWRDDCRAMRERNPFTAHWTDGTWSSDYSRSGWCPGDVVTPMEFDLTDHLTPGRHRVGVRIEDVRLKDAKGNHGYWRVSASVIGWDHAPALWRN
jgi:Peptide-N-glycosidase F, C terminal/Peptide-N-glycosidase F, N terminal